MDDKLKQLSDELIKLARKENKEKELMSWAYQMKVDEIFQKLTLENIDNVIRTYEETVGEMEEALQNNIEYPSDKQRYELALIQIKEKKSWFFNFLKKYIKYKLKRSIESPKRLDKGSRKFLEEEIKRYKWTIVYLRELRKKKIGN